MTNKAILNFFYGCYFSAIVLFLVLPETIMPDFYKANFMIGTSVLSVALVFIFGYSFSTNSKKQNDVVEYCQAALAVSIGLNGIGGLGLYKLYKVGIPYDKIMHFVIPVILLVFGAYFLVHRLNKTKKYAIIFMVIAIFVGSVLWEGVEVGQDRLFGTKTAGVYGEDYINDTILDIVSAIAGLAVGAYWLTRSRGKNMLSIEKI